MSNLSFIHPDAKIGQNVVIEPFAYIEADVVIGDNCWIGPHAVIMNGARIGNRCKIFTGAVVSSIPQDLKFKGERTFLKIGDDTIVREFCTLNRATGEGNYTIIGSKCLLMAYVHVAHDCVIKNNCILANNVTLAGHIEIGDYAVLGGFTAVHQFVHIGKHVMIGGTGKVRKDVPPFVKADRDPLSYVGVNTVGLQRRGFTNDQIDLIKDCYRWLFVKGLNVKQAVEQIEQGVPICDERDQILDFIRDETRGLIKGPRLNGAKFRPHDDDETTED